MPKLCPIRESSVAVSEQQVEEFISRSGMLDKLSAREKIPHLMEKHGIGLDETVRHLASVQKYCDEPSVKLNAIKLNFQLCGLMTEEGRSIDTSITFNISGTSDVKVLQADLQGMLNPKR